MSKEVQIRRGTTAEHIEFVGKQGEVTMDTERNCLVVHDGETAGGHPVAKKSETDALATQLDANTTALGNLSFVVAEDGGLDITYIYAGE